MIHPVEPKKVLCIHDLSGMGRCSLAVILPVLSVMGVQPVALPTVVLSTHTGGLGTPARLDGNGLGDIFHSLVIGPSVEREPGMVESVTERIAPMPVITPDSGGDGIRLGLENDTGAVRIDDILQDTRPGIVAGDDKHTVFRHLGHLHLGFLLA